MGVRRGAAIGDSNGSVGTAPSRLGLLGLAIIVDAAVTRRGCVSGPHETNLSADGERFRLLIL